MSINYYINKYNAHIDCREPEGRYGTNKDTLLTFTLSDSYRCNNKCVKLVEWLINNGIDISIKNRNGANAFDMICNTYNCINKNDNFLDNVLEIIHILRTTLEKKYGIHYLKVLYGDNYNIDKINPICIGVKPALILQSISHCKTKTQCPIGDYVVNSRSPLTNILAFLYLKQQPNTTTIPPPPPNSLLKKTRSFRPIGVNFT